MLLVYWLWLTSHVCSSTLVCCTRRTTMKPSSKLLPLLVRFFFFFLLLAFFLLFWFSMILFCSFCIFRCFICALSLCSQLYVDSLSVWIVSAAAYVKHGGCWMNIVLSIVICCCCCLRRMLLLLSAAVRFCFIFVSFLFLQEQIPTSFAPWRTTCFALTNRTRNVQSAMHMCLLDVLEWVMTCNFLN